MTPKEFENEVRVFLSKKWGIYLEERFIEVRKFDLVSEDNSIVGDAKFYKFTEGGNAPSAKISTIAEMVWNLEHVKAKRKFIVFGNDKNVPLVFLGKAKGIWGKIVKESNIEFYFYKDGELERLN